MISYTLTKEDEEDEEFAGTFGYQELESIATVNTPVENDAENLLDLKNALENIKCCCCISRKALIFLFTFTLVLEAVNAIGVYPTIHYFILLIINVIFCGSGLYGLLYYKLKWMVICMHFGVGLLICSIIDNVAIIMSFNEFLKDENYDTYDVKDLRIAFIISTVLLVIFRLWIIKHVRAIVQAMKFF